MKPSLFLNVRSAVPGCALKLSAAPPTTMQIALPSPSFSMFAHDPRDTLQMPRASRTSRYTGIRKFDARVSRCGRMPGYAFVKPVASVANVASAPLFGVNNETIIRISRGVHSNDT